MVSSISTLVRNTLTLKWSASIFSSYADPHAIYLLVSCVKIIYCFKIWQHLPLAIRAITGLLPPAYQQSSNEENFTNLPVVKAEIASVGDKSCSNIAAVSQVEQAAMLQTGQQQDENYFVSTGTCLIYSFCSHIYTVLLFWDTFSVSSINYFTYKCPKLHTIKQELK